MKRIILPPMSSLHLVSAALLMGWLTASALAQSSNQGIVDDWSSHHVIFSNPGTVQDAMMNGRREKWERIMHDPRYRMQQARHGLPLAGRTTTPTVGLPRAPKATPSDSNSSSKIANLRRQRLQESSVPGDWTVPLGGNGPPPGDYPAKFGFDVTAAPDCTNDFVVFPISVAGNNNQANLVGVNNLYSGTCTTGTVPTVLFAYFVGTGKILTSPVISLDGTKVAFVESDPGGSIFHVLTLDKSGNGGCPSSPCNGTAFSSPSVPSTANAAVDIKITMSGVVNVTQSSPFVDYTNDIAYVGDDSGNLHKFTGVFLSSPVEVVDGTWPVIVNAGTTLSPAVYDSGASQNIFVGDSNGNLYCIHASDGAFCGTPSIIVGDGPNGGIVAGPIVDSTTQRVFVTANDAVNSRAVLTQVTTSMGSEVIVPMGPASNTNRYNGAFDNAYFTNVAQGHMYFCGNDTSGSPALLRVGFGNNGQINATNDGNSFSLATGATGPNIPCTPLTEVFNPSISLGGLSGTDLLFVGLQDHGTCVTANNNPCIMSFDITNGFPAGQITSFVLSGNLGTSGIIVDNVSGGTGASNIYYGDLSSNNGVQLSQSGLQ